MSGQYYLASFEDLYGRKCRRMSIFWLLFIRLGSTTRIYSYLNWYNPHPYPFLCSFFPYRNFKDEIFVRWMKCNTSFSEYIFRYVFRFFDHIFWFTSCICFVLWLIMRLFCIGSGFVDSESALVWTENPFLVYYSI